MKQRLNEGFAVNFQDAIARFTLDTATEFLFGRCVHSLRDSVLPYSHNAPAMYHNLTHSPADEFASAFLEAQHAIAHRARKGWIWPWFEIFRSKTAAPMRVVDAFLEPILQSALDKKKAIQRSDPAEYKTNDECLLDDLVRQTAGD